MNITAKLKFLKPNLSKKAEKVPHWQNDKSRAKRLQKSQIWLIWLYAMRD